MKAQAKGSDMGIRISCPNGHKLNVKEQLAGKRGICPVCQAAFVIPALAESRPAEPAAVKSEGIGAQGAPSSIHISPAATSVVIPVVEPVVTATPTISPPPDPAPASAVTVPAPPQAPEAQRSQAPAEPIVIQPAVHVSEPVESPSARFIAKRMRSRRNQTTLAIALLLAVIILAGLLLWVLLRGPAASSDVAHARISYARVAHLAFAVPLTLESRITSARL